MKLHPVIISIGGNLLGNMMKVTFKVADLSTDVLETIAEYYTLLELDRCEKGGWGSWRGVASEATVLRHDRALLGLLTAQPGTSVNEDQQMVLSREFLHVEGQRCALWGDDLAPIMESLRDSGVEPLSYETSDKRLKWFETLHDWREAAIASGALYGYRELQDGIRQEKATKVAVLDCNGDELAAVVRGQSNLAVFAMVARCAVLRAHGKGCIKTVEYIA